MLVHKDIHNMIFVSFTAVYTNWLIKGMFLLNFSHTYISHY
jgi:hypothetical protein